MNRSLFFIAVLSAGLTVAAGDKSINENVDADGRTQLEISHGHGNITVQGWDQDRVSLSGTITTRGKWNKRLDDLDVEVTTSGNTVMVKVIKPQANWSGSGSYRIDYELKAPRGMSVNLSNSHGQTYITDFQGDVDLKTSHGNLEGSHFEGDLNLTANHGHAEIRDVGGRANVQHNHGNLELVDLNGDLDYKGNHGKAVLVNINGSIRLENSHGKVDIDGVDGGVKGTINHSNLVVTTSTVPNGNYQLKASHGNITLHFPEDTGMDLGLETRHGSISTNTSISVEKERNAASLRGKVRDGNVKVRLDANHGNVTVKTH